MMILDANSSRKHTNFLRNDTIICFANIFAAIYPFNILIQLYLYSTPYDMKKI